MPLASVIIPTYNRQDKLKRAILSVLNQTFTDLEILVINDSQNSEGVIKVISELQDKRIKYFGNERKKGGNGARNTGLLKAIGKYIAFLDDDDEWLQRKLEMQINKLRQLDYTICGGVYCGYLMLNHNRWYRIKVCKANLRKLLLHEVSVCASSTVVFHKSAIEKVGLFDEYIERHQDVDYLIRFFRYYEALEVVNEPLVKIYGHNPPNASKLEKAKIKLLDKAKEDIDKLSHKEKKYYYAFEYRELAVAFSKEGNLSNTFFYLKKSISNSILFPTRYIKIILNFLKLKLGVDFVRFWEDSKMKLLSLPFHTKINRFL